jgi:hypothetical protein
VGKSEDTWLINDPGFDRLTLKKGYDNKVFALRIFKPVDLNRTSDSFITLRLHSPAELIVIDSQGRQTGFDSTQELESRQIPDSSYSWEDLADDESGASDPDPSKHLTLIKPQGNYTLKVIGIGNGTFEVTSVAFDQTASSLTFSSILGVTSKDRVSEFSIAWQPGNPAGSLALQRRVTFESAKEEVQLLLNLSLIDNPGIANSLIQKLEAAKAAKDRSQTNAAKNILNAFLNELEAQKEKHVRASAFNILKEDAQVLLQN